MQAGTVNIIVKSSGVLMPGLDPDQYYNHSYHLVLESTLFGVLPYSAIPVIVICTMVAYVACAIGVPFVHKMILEEGAVSLASAKRSKKPSACLQNCVLLNILGWVNDKTVMEIVTFLTPTDAPTSFSAAINKKRKFVADGVFFAELNSFLTKELSEQGYSGVEVRVTPTRTEIIIRATKTQDVLGDKGRRIRELTSVVQKRFNFPENTVELYAERVASRGLSAIAQAESLRHKLLEGLAVRRACYSVMRIAMESGAKGVEVIVSGKLRGARAKSMKFVDGFMIHSGQPSIDFIDFATRNVLMRQGMLGIKVKIMLPAENGKRGKMPLPDNVTILEPKEDAVPAAVPVAVPVATFKELSNPSAVPPLCTSLFLFSGLLLLLHTSNRPSQHCARSLQSPSDMHVLKQNSFAAAQFGPQRRGIAWARFTDWAAGSGGGTEGGGGLDGGAEGDNESMPPLAAGSTASVALDNAVLVPPVAEAIEMAIATLKFEMIFIWA
ncbi:40S ribosomal protein S3 [Entophlyctis luteolus]|nr:40S ribosomal protein S3 [Entophlyctis luteolus]